MNDLVFAEFAPISVTKTMTTCTGHRLIDYDGPCQYIHGHNYKWEVTARLKSTSPNQPVVMQNGMVIDFSDLKKLMEIYIKQEYDHKLVLCEQDFLIDLVGTAPLNKGSAGGMGGLLVLQDNPTVEVLAYRAYSMLRRHCTRENCTFDIQRIKVWETDTSFAEVPFA